MTIIYRQVARISNGKRFFVREIDKNKVRCLGSVVSRGGLAPTHEPADRIFLLNRVILEEVEFTETLLDELIAQDKTDV